MSNVILIMAEVLAFLLMAGVVIKVVWTAYGIIKKKNDLSKMKSVVITIGIVIIIFCIVDMKLIFDSNIQTYKDKTITCVKNTCPKECQISYGQALDNYLSDIKWEYVDSGNNTMVRVNGNHVDGSENDRITLMFVCHNRVKNATDFNIYYVEINGKKCVTYEANNLLNEAFSDYAEKNNLLYEYTYFFAY